MEAKDKMIEILNTTFVNLSNCVNVDNSKAQEMTNPKHRELVERYAKVLSHHYVGKLAHLCTSLLTMEFDNEEKEKKIFNKFENRMNEIVDDFPKDFNATMKSVKKYFGHAYNDECLRNVVADSFLQDLKIEKESFLDWTINLDMTPNVENHSEVEKVSA